MTKDRETLARLAKHLARLANSSDDAELVKGLGRLLSLDRGAVAVLARIRREALTRVVTQAGSQRAAAKQVGMQQSNISAALRQPSAADPDWLA